MIKHEGQMPEWARQEREGDLAWIGENFHILWPAAQVGYETVGRGAIVVDTTSRPTGEGHPFGYLDQAAIEYTGDEDTQRMVDEYEPREEFVTALLKAEERVSSYRLKVTDKEQREPLGDRAEFAQREEAEAEAELQTPSLEQLMAWEWEGGCEAACPHGCWVESDGRCEHGKNSWLIELGLI